MAVAMFDDSGGRAPTDAHGGALRLAEYTVDVDELRATANRVLGLSDVIDTVARRGAMNGAGTYGGFVDEPARTWSVRYSYLLQGLAEQVEHAGHELRGTADAYHEVELTVRDRLRELEARMPAVNHP